MVLDALLLVLALATAYFHYVQGFFSSAISAICAAFAAVIALGYQESLANMMVGSAPEQAASLSIVLIFAAAYIIPRLILDSFVPGNVRFPVILDKVGAGVMGLLAGLISTGILGIAIQALPFGTVIGMYSRFPVADRTGRVMNARRGQYDDITSYDVMQADSLDPAQTSHLWSHADDLVVGLENKVSDGGSMAGEQPFSAVHPDYLDELFGQRIGIQVGTKHTVPPKTSLSIAGVFTQPSFTQVDGEISDVRSADKPLPAVLTPEPQHTLIVVRASFTTDKNTDDSDNYFRFSPGSVRLVCGRPSDSGGDYREYHPVATLDSKRRIAVGCAPDDFLFLDSGSYTIDFVFNVDDDIAIGGDSKSKQIVPGAFLEIKRYGQADLGGKPITAPADWHPNPDPVGILRKTEIATAISKAREVPLPNGSSSAAPVADVSAGAVAANEADGLTFKAPLVASSKIPFPIDSKSGNPSGNVDLPTGVKGDFATRKWTHLTVTPTTSTKDLAGTGDDAIADLTVPDGQSLIQVHCAGPTSGEVWAWGNDLAKFQLVDNAGHTYKIVGAWAKVRHSTDSLAAVSFASDTPGAIPPIVAQSSQGRPTDIYLAFYVPSGTNIEELRFGKGAMASNLNFAAP